MPAIYQADNWCDSCADKIKGDLRAAAGKGGFDFNPGDERTYDSDQYPKYAGDDEESDTPQHCASGAGCLEAEELPDGTRIGAIFGKLTEVGIAYVVEVVKGGGMVAHFWRKHYEAEGYDFDLPDECPIEHAVRSWGDKGYDVQEAISTLATLKSDCASLLSSLQRLLAHVGDACFTAGRLHTEESCSVCASRAAIIKAKGIIDVQN